MPVKQCQKMGLVMDVKSAVLGETVVFAPTTEVAGETRVVYTWREGFIIAKAQPAPELLRYAHEIKRAFPGSSIESIVFQDGGKGEVKMTETPQAAKPKRVVPWRPDARMEPPWDAVERPADYGSQQIVLMAEDINRGIWNGERSTRETQGARHLGTVAPHEWQRWRGYAGELAVARWSGLLSSYPDKKTKPLPDIGPFEVKTIPSRYHELQIVNGMDLDRPYVLVELDWSESDVATLVGWAWGKEAWELSDNRYDSVEQTTSCKGGSYIGLNKRRLRPMAALLKLFEQHGDSLTFSAAMAASMASRLPAPDPEASDVYLVDDPQLLTGQSLESLLPRRPSQ